MPEPGIAIEVRGLRKSYAGAPVLRGIDLRVEPGETLVIVGGSGEGKSVLLRHIAGLEAPDEGSISFNGMELQEYLRVDPQAKPFRISMVFQGAALLNSLSVRENVALRMLEHGTVPRSEVSRIVEECLRVVDLHGTEEKLPSELSGGMRKRAAIARALAVDPQVILHDEPTADLDPILTEQIGELILRIQNHRHATQIVVTHNLALATEVGNRIAVLRKGEIIDLLPATELSTSRNEYTQEFVRAASLRSGDMRREAQERSPPPGGGS